MFRGIPKRFKIASLFSGIGAYVQALWNIGYNGWQTDIAFYAENNKDAIKVFEALWGYQNNLGDVRKITEADVERFKEKIDLLVMGPPCQDFSVGGKGAGATKNTRSGVIWDALNVIAWVQPTAVVMENVKGLLTRHKKTLLEIIDIMKENGYPYHMVHLMNAKDDGLPQNRERIYVVFTKVDIRYTLPEKPVEKMPTLREFLPELLERETVLIPTEKGITQHKSYYSFLEKQWNNHRAWFIDGYVGCLLGGNTTKWIAINQLLMTKLTWRDAWKLQGWNEKKFQALELWHRIQKTGVSGNKLAQLAGNSMAIPSLQKVLDHLTDAMRAHEIKLGVVH